MLLSYKEIVRFLLRQDDYLGVTAKELEFLRASFGLPHTRVDTVPALVTQEGSSPKSFSGNTRFPTRRIACTFLD
jgi:hypothetical protein